MEDLASVIQGLEFKIYESASNLGFVNDIKTKLNTKYEEMVQQLRLLEEGIVTNRSSLKEEQRVHDNELRRRKRAIGLHSQLRKQLEGIEVETGEIQGQINHQQDILDHYTKNDRKRDGKLDRMLDENARLENSQSELELKLHHALANIASIQRQKDQEIMQLRSKYEEEHESSIRARAELESSRQALKAQDTAFEALRVAEHAKELDLIRTLADSSEIQNRVQSKFAIRNRLHEPHEYFDASYGHPSDNCVHQPLDDYDHHPIGTKRAASSIQKQADDDARFVALSNQLCLLEAAMNSKLTQAPEAPIPHARESLHPSGENKFGDSRKSDIPDLQIKLTHLETLISQQQQYQQRASAAESSALLQCQTANSRVLRDMENMHADVHVRLLNIESALKLQFENRFQTLEEKLALSTRSIAMNQNEVIASSQGVLEHQKELRLIRDNIRTLDNEATVISTSVTSLNARLQSVEKLVREHASVGFQISTRLGVQEETLANFTKELTSVRRTNQAAADLVTRAMTDLKEANADKAKVKASLVALHNRLNRLSKTTTEAAALNTKDLAKLTSSSQQHNVALQLLENHVRRTDEQLTAIGYVVSQDLFQPTPTPAANGNQVGQVEEQVNHQSPLKHGLASTVSPSPPTSLKPSRLSGRFYPQHANPNRSGVRAAVDNENMSSSYQGNDYTALSIQGGNTETTGDEDGADDSVPEVQSVARPVLSKTKGVRMPSSISRNNKPDKEVSATGSLPAYLDVDNEGTKGRVGAIKYLKRRLSGTALPRGGLTLENLTLESVKKTFDELGLDDILTLLMLEPNSKNDREILQRVDELRVCEQQISGLISAWISQFVETHDRNLEAPDVTPEILALREVHHELVSFLEERFPISND